ncbi:YkgJ family cysteine cluster protein, partial [Candidatus Pacearchaeota archaeon]|nr:YkgJ family cysteine cluster protein [Candidatus Pacearchaeota archaeon]
KFIHNGYGIDIDTKSLEMFKLYGELKDLYSKIPKTKCLNCPGKKGVEADCCKVFSPPMLLIEFLHILRSIEDDSEEERKDLYYRCFESYLNPSYEKRCVLLNDDNQCIVYNTRPFSCRMFGLYEEQEWEDRLKSITEEIKINETSETPDEENVPFAKQCKGIKIKKKKEKIKSITKGTSDYIYKHIHYLDINVFPEELAKDAAAVVMGSYTYLPFVAQYLLMQIGQEKLDNLATMKITVRKLEKEDKLKFAKNMGEIDDFLKIVKKEIFK